jgi:hypothetical protein
MTTVEPNRSRRIPVLTLLGALLLTLPVGCKSPYQSEYSVQFLRDADASKYKDPSIPIVVLLTDERENHRYPAEFAPNLQEIDGKRIEAWFKEDDILKQTLKGKKRMWEVAFLPVEAASSKDAPPYGGKHRIVIEGDALDDLGDTPGGTIFIIANFTAENAKDHRTFIPLENGEETEFFIVVKSNSSLTRMRPNPVE